MYRRPAIFLLIWLITLGLSGVEGYGQWVGVPMLSNFKNAQYGSLRVKEAALLEINDRGSRIVDEKEFDADGFLLRQDSCSYNAFGQVGKRYLKVIRYDTTLHEVLIHVMDSLDPEIGVDSSRTRLVFDDHWRIDLQEVWDSRHGMEKTTINYTYDAAGNLTGYVTLAKGDAAQTEIKRKYGPEGQILEESVSGLENSTRQFVYDDGGRLVLQRSSGKCEFQWIYSPAGLLAQKRSGCCKEPDSPAFCHGLVENYSYDHKGRLLTYEWIQAFSDGGRESAVSVIERYEYDRNGLLARRCGLSNDTCREYSYKFHQDTNRK